MSDLASQRPQPPATIILVLIGSIGSLGLNIFVPSMPAMADYFQTDYRIIQLAVSLYLGGMALIQFCVGPLSDRYGRRPVLLACFSIFIVSTAAAIYAPNIQFLLVCRVFQACSAAGIVLSRAVVRDTVTRLDEAASKIGYVATGMSLVPMLAPTLGGMLDEMYGWKSTFVLMLAAAILALTITWFFLPETNHRRSSSMMAQIRGYPQLLGSPRYWGYTLAAGLSSGAFFAFLGGAPYIATQILGLSPSVYGMYFAILAAGYTLGNFSSGRFSRYIGINRMMFIGNSLACIGIALSIVLFALGFDHAVTLFGPVVAVGIGNGMTLPNAGAGAVSIRPQLAGSASGLSGTLQLGTGALLSFIAGATLSAESGPYPLLWVMLISSALALAATAFVMYIDRQAARSTSRS